MGVFKRISSFVTWPPESTTSPLSLANAGFLYTGEGDTVRCPICRLEIAGWSDEPGHVQTTRLRPRDEHRIRSPQCQLALECSRPDSEVISTIRNKICQQDALSADAVGHADKASLVRPQSDGSTQSGMLQAGRKPPSDNMHAILKQVLDRATKRSSECEVRLDATRTPPKQLAVVDRTNPDFSLLKSESARLGTYHDWPSTVPVKPEELAADGFFYTGRTDRVSCAFCRGILHNWQQGDVPSAEHRRHFRSCPFVRGQNVGNIPARRDQSAKVATATYTTEGGSSNVASNECRSDVGHSCNNEPAATTTTGNGSYPSSAGQGPKQPLERSRVNITNAAENATLLTEDDEERQLLTENQHLMETMTCKVCLDRAVNTVFLPCGHLVACDECSPRLRNCPICRTYIRGTVKTFLS